MTRPGFPRYRQQEVTNAAAQPQIPVITDELLTYLVSRFSPVDPTPGMALDSMMYRAGAFSVVKHLIDLKESQENV